MNVWSITAENEMARPMMANSMITPPPMSIMAPATAGRRWRCWPRRRCFFLLPAALAAVPPLLLPLRRGRLLGARGLVVVGDGCSGGGDGGGGWGAIAGLEGGWMPAAPLPLPLPPPLLPPLAPAPPPPVLAPSAARLPITMSIARGLKGATDAAAATAAWPPMPVVRDARANVYFYPMRERHSWNEKCGSGGRRRRGACCRLAGSAQARHGAD